jgi:hypothetical protein
MLKEVLHLLLIIITIIYRLKFRAVTMFAIVQILLQTECLYLLTN